MRQSIISLFIMSLLCGSAAAQTAWRQQASGTTASLRGLSVVSDKVAWASGTQGTVLRTVDGVRWQVINVANAEKLDFRDLHAFDEKNAVIMSAGPGDASRIYRTSDGGASWHLQATNQYAEGFWDAMSFWDANNGILFGDPVKGKFQVLVTADGGANWNEVRGSGLEALEAEGAFAASGTCLTVAGKGDVWIGSGGAKTSRVFHSSDRGATWQAATVAIPAGAPTKGVFSLGFLNPRTGMAVGGDYKETKLATLNGVRTEDGGTTWAPAAILPEGFMSVVMPVPGAPNSFVAAGLAGSGFSRDGGKSWKVLDLTAVNTVGFASPTAGWAIGPKGLVLQYTGPALTQ
ncbi:hypothetical protein [Massilia sp. TSP1-1-2]|uniref:WD40/YVTN/BNR-like repeat-containing protein n=1 Tax=unclassified Massilia TaxID=2609279 RepID=UPI003CF5B475